MTFSNVSIYNRNQIIIMESKYIKPLLKSIAKKEINESKATQILNEAALSFSAGEKVYVAHGIHAGSRGKFLGEQNGGYASIDLGESGKPKYIPIIFLQHAR